MTNRWYHTPEGREWKRKYDRDHYPEQREARRLRAITRRKNKRAWVLVDAARRRSQQQGLEFDLDGFREELQARIDAGACEVSGIAFNLNGGRTYDSPSLDRIDPKRGYVYDNVRVVCDLINRAFSDWGEKPFEIVATAYLSRRKRQNSSEPT